jgi:hypothetical protein
MWFWRENGAPHEYSIAGFFRQALLVTGSLGCIDSNLARRLVNAGAQEIAISYPECVEAEMLDTTYKA